jgi:hemoglobin
MQTQKNSNTAHHSFSQCDITQKFIPVGTKESMIDFVYPEVPFPPKELFTILGKEKIIQMVEYHHGLLKKSVIKDLFEKDEEKFKVLTMRTAEFFMEALGGGDIYSEKHGHPHLRARHFPFSIDEHAREVWLMFYKKTLKDIEFPKEHIQVFWEWIEPLSIRMINRRTSMDAPKRFPFESVKQEFKIGENNE